MLTLGNWEIILSLLTGGTKCIRLYFILQIQLNSTRQERCKEKQYSGIASIQGKHIKKKKLTVLADSSFFFFLLSVQLEALHLR